MLTAVWLSALCAAATAHADPQWNLALSAGGGARALHTQTPDGVFTLGLRGDVMFGPRTPYAARVGPWFALRSDDFDDFAAAAGLALQLPVSAAFPLMLSLGGAAVLAPDGPRTAALGRIAWGTRSYNDHSAYVMAGGLFVEARYFPGDGAADVIVGVDIDLRLITLPVVILHQYLRGAR